MFMGQPYLSTARGESSISAAVQWISGILTGEIGTAIAVLAIAGVGFSLLQGRMAIRQGARVVLGCFILFGAAGIANGLASLAYGNGSGSPAYFQATPLEPLPLPAPPPVNRNPYAGASVPMR